MRAFSITSAPLVVLALQASCVASPTEPVHDTRADAAALDASLQDASRLDATAQPDGSSDGAVEGGSASSCHADADCTGRADGRVHCAPTGACVGCRQDDDCPTTSPSCSAGSCTHCTASAACTRFATTPVCGASGACVACTAQEPAACTAQSQVCKTNANSCVQCNQSADCATASAARCAQNACAACASDDDCAHIAGKPVCNAGSCVACTPASEAQRCGDNACNPDTLTCTSTKRASLGACAACQSDSECIENYRCIQVPFMGQSSGFYCMRIGGPACSAPYGATPITATSKSGAAATQYCAHNTSQASCDAVAAMFKNKSCTIATVAMDCGAGGQCETVNLVPNRCTYACSNNATCPTNFSCNADHANDPYCGGP